MLHFSCDGCGKPLGDDRYVLRIEAYPAFDPEQLQEADLDVDHLQEVAQTLAEVDECATSPEDEHRSRQYRFDLCATCHKKFLRDPIGREAHRRLDFSNN